MIKMNKYLKKISAIAILFLVSCAGASETKKENKTATVKSPNIIFILTLNFSLGTSRCTCELYYIYMAWAYYYYSAILM